MTKLTDELLGERDLFRRKVAALLTESRELRTLVENLEKRFARIVVLENALRKLSKDEGWDPQQVMDIARHALNQFYGKTR